jgi:pimeloyl-ACP methyl ester carboxylesterase
MAPNKFKDFLRSRESRESRSPSPLVEPSPLTHEASPGYSLQATLPQDLPTQTTIHPASTAAQIQASSAPIKEGKNYGIQELYNGGIEPRVDIVFVHGLTGNAYNTWLHQKTGVHWPSELLGQDIPDARILSFGYDADIVNFWTPASNNGLSNHAENMVGRLVRKREKTNTETRKILFVGHSLGGLVIEQALHHSRNTSEKHLCQIEHCTAGIIFLGVPHCGADLASWAYFGTQMVNLLKRANKNIVRVLEPGSDMLRSVQNGFHNILRLRKDEGSGISVTCFYEELPVAGVGEV